MSLELLDKTRKINKLLTEQESDKVDFRQFCEVLSKELHVNVLLTSKKGKVLGLKEYDDIDVFPKLKDAHYGEYIDAALKDRFMSILSRVSGDGCACLYVRKKAGNLICL